ncbi:MAG: hypothetical protein JSR47_22390 [Proteobacteria bacterium]|nr:hypothetical protein [Pseudomonadota bacterium]
MRLFAATLLVALSLAPVCRAQSSAQDYLAARDQAAITLKQRAQLEENDPSQKIGKPEYFAPAFRAEIEAARRDLEARMRDLIGPLRVPVGVARTGTLNAAPCCYGRFGALDGLAFDAPAGNRLIVSTEPLLQHWLKESSDFWTVDARPSSDPAVLFTNANFYRWAGATDWPVRKVADLPIGLPDNTSAVGAFLAAGGPTESADWLAIAAIRNGRVFVSFVPTKTKTAPIAACDAAPATYRDCWATHAKEQPWFADMLLETLAFVDALPEQ